VKKVAKLQALILSGKVGVGATALEKLLDDKNPETVTAATACLTLVNDWKSGMDTDIAKYRAEGDLYLAAELLTSMTSAYTGDVGKGYKDQLNDVKKDPGYEAGQAYQKLRQMPYAQRKDPRFASLVASFVKKYPDGYYSKQALSLVPKE
jgi:hypothetical protein